MDKYVQRLISLNGIFSMGSMMSSVFTNIFLWQLTKDLYMITIYNILYYSAFIIFFPIGAYYTKTKSTIIMLKIGIVAQMTFFILIIILRENTVNYMPYLGFLFGIGNSSYWNSLNQLVVDYTNSENRDEYNGINGIIGSVSSMGAPLLAGFIIAAFNGFIGYYVVFFITFLMFLLSLVIAKGLREGKYLKKYNFFHCYFNYRKEWFYLNVTQFIIGIRDGVFTFLIGILLFEKINTESSFGVFSSIQGFFTMAVYYILSKKINQNNRMKYLDLGSKIMLLAPLPLFIGNGNKFWILIYLLAYALGTANVGITINTILFNSIEKLAPKYMKSEYLAVREVNQNIGRVFGLLLFIFVIKNLGELGKILFLFGINSCYILTYIIIKNKINKL